MKIYTKGGDTGISSLFTGQRRSKSDQIFEALGNTDELNACIGLSKTAIQDPQLLQHLTEIQCRILDLGSSIATPSNTASEPKLKKTHFDQSHVLKLQSWIDSLQQELPPLRNFILPGGGEGAARLHVARTICRRTQRSLVPLLQSDSLDHQAYTYVNRLSDLLFVMARIAAHRAGEEETPYQKSSQFS